MFYSQLWIRTVNLHSHWISQGNVTIMEWKQYQMKLICHCLYWKLRKPTIHSCIDIEDKSSWVSFIWVLDMSARKMCRLACTFCYRLYRLNYSSFDYFWFYLFLEKYGLITVVSVWDDAFLRESWHDVTK